MNPNPKILIVEDDNFLANTCRVKCESEDFETRIASTGVEALKIMHEFEPDLIILDILLPEKNGFEFLEDISKNPKWSKIPVIIASNLGQEDDIKKGLDLGAKDYFVKSNVSLEEMIEKIRKYI